MKNSTKGLNLSSVYLPTTEMDFPTNFWCHIDHCHQYTNDYVEPYFTARNRLLELSKSNLSSMFIKL